MSRARSEDGRNEWPIPSVGNSLFSKRLAYGRWWVSGAANEDEPDAQGLAEWAAVERCTVVGHFAFLMKFKTVVRAPVMESHHKLAVQGHVQFW